MRVLVVEDFTLLRRSLVRGLRQAGYAVDEAKDGDEGLFLAQTNEYDVLVLDLMLPRMDGIEVLRTLRGDENKTPTLILTAKDQLDDKVSGLDAGADDYLVKPFAFEELLARLRALTRRRYDDADAVITVGPLVIDTSNKRVELDGDKVVLSAREYSLLEYLARRRGQPVSRLDIWEHLYDANDTNTSNVVDVYIGYLRKKLHRDGAPELIRTYRGTGYALEEP